MANDFKIKFEYKGIGKKAASERQKAIAAQKSAKKSGVDSPVNKEFISSVKSLNLSIQKLIASNKNLENAIKQQRSSGGGTTGGGNGEGPAPGLGHVGGAMPLGLGVAIAGAGFMIQKISQIGNAYIQKAGEQFGNVGTVGFRRAKKGMYSASEIGAGMKNYSLGTGKFEYNTKVNRAALQSATMFGVSPDETLGQAGIFKRAGGKYGKTMYQAAGTGIESELPMLMSGLSSILEEAVKEGINTSDMARDIGNEISNLTMHTPGKSVGAALSMVNKFQGIREPLTKGIMGESLENMYAAQATKSLLMKSITGKGGTDYIKNLTSSGYITSGQAGELSKLGPNASYSDLQKSIGSMGAHTLFKKKAAEASSDDLMVESMRNAQKQYGTGPLGFQNFSTVMDQVGSQYNQSQRMALWQSASNPSGNNIAKGKNIIQGGVSGVVSSGAGMSRNQTTMREDMILDFGEKFAKVTFRIEQSLLQLARGGADLAIKGINDATEAFQKLSVEVNKFSNISPIKTISELFD